MERKIVKDLLAWKNKPDKLPLLLQGARQVGKTYILLSFGKQYYKNVAYFSMEESREIPAIFERDLNPERIIRELAAQSGQSIFPEDTLIVFDEIQACEQALTALKYFAERAPQYHIIAAGSLLGVAMKREKFSFPVGKVDMLPLYPMDFEEFLWAVGQEKLCHLIRDSYEGFTPLSLHDTAMDLYRTYLVVGGMPRVVQEYADKRDFDFVVALHRTLNDSYIADMAKYAAPQETTRIMAAWASVPAQLAKENRKFQYKVIKSGARAGEYAVALDWLKAAGMIHKCIHVTEGKMPLSAYAENEAFKVYMVDTGLLCSKLDIAAHIVLHTPHSFDGFKGALAENYIMQALVTNGITPYYWSSSGKAEVDFVFQDRQGNIIPLEAKSADNVRAKSLRNYRDIYKPIHSVRVSAKNFGFENSIKSVPLYAAFCLKG
ncbi:MAG: ATP-binding protein [Oscillospiraceae bacterium]|jgi:predicted AAA+ superfamily ATPase|nr:ATP-binding protein [Oscillospiraceae bacterium]